MIEILEILVDGIHFAVLTFVVLGIPAVVILWFYCLCHFLWII